MAGWHVINRYMVAIVCCGLSLLINGNMRVDSTFFVISCAVVLQVRHFDL